MIIIVCGVKFAKSNNFLSWRIQELPPRRSRSRSHSPGRRRGYRDHERSRRHSRSPGHHRSVNPME